MLHTMAFFNEKGGSAKTTFTTLMASFLSYQCHEQVEVIDFDFPNYHLFAKRNTDNRLCTEENKIFKRMCEEAGAPYRITKGPFPRENTEYSREELTQMVSSLRRRKLLDDGYLLFDFPGRYKQMDPIVWFAAEGLIDLVVFPITSDNQSRVAALMVNQLMHQPRFRARSGKPQGQETFFFWNNVNPPELKSKDVRYDKYDAALRAIGVHTSTTRIRHIPVISRDAENPLNFICSTRCYPEINIRRYCPYLDTLFVEIKGLLDNVAAK